MTKIAPRVPLSAPTMERVDAIVQASGKYGVAYFDIDGTLLTDDHAPNVKVLALLHHLHQRGLRIYLWSAGGEENCREAAAICGITDLISGYLPKPVISVDDMRYDDYVFLKLHPGDLDPKD
jgi:hypothetical protein